LVQKDVKTVPMADEGHDVVRAYSVNCSHLELATPSEYLAGFIASLEYHTRPEPFSDQRHSGCSRCRKANHFPSSLPAFMLPSKHVSHRLKLVELLDLLAGSGQDTQNIESDSLAERSALANSDLVTLLNTECWRNVGGKVLVALLVTRVLGDEVEVFTADDERAVHLGRDDGAGEDTATDRDQTSEGALLVDVVALNGGLGRPEAQADVLVPSPASLSDSLALAALALGVEENVWLLLESALALDGQFGGHDCGVASREVCVDLQVF